LLFAKAGGKDVMRVWNRNLSAVLTVALLWFGATGQAQAISLGNVNVTSHLGEPFYAEVPLTLDASDALSGISIKLATSADYRILEMYRDAAMDILRVDVVNDARGARISIRSEADIATPFFNMVLKVSRGHSTQFKKYPVFLDLPKLEVHAPRPAVAPAPAPAAEAAGTASAKALPAKEKAFRPFSGWARIQRYGPMAYGDSLSIVSHRLRIDKRYTQQQVMAALFAKNSDKFTEKNMNMIEAGAYLDVPAAEEVEAISPARARAIVAEHNQRWKKLKKLPRYAAIYEAQRYRYGKRVRIGRKATGKAAGIAAGKAKPVAVKPAAISEKASKSPELKALRQQNEKLTQQLRESESVVSQLKSDIASNADVMAANERINKLELKLARLQAELTDAREQAESSGNGMANWLIYGLAGLVVLLLAALGYLMRRERPHPAMMQETATDSDFMASAPVQTEPLFAGTPAPADSPAEKQSVHLEASVETEAGEPAMMETPAPEIKGENAAEDEANVDYLAEADVYLRYGMHDEAIHQLRLAIEQREDNDEAHCKLVQVLHTKGDQAALEAAISHAANVLSGEGMQKFEAVVSSLDMADGETSEDKASPATEYGEAEGLETASTAGVELEEMTAGSDLSLGEDGLGSGGMEWLSEEETGEADFDSQPELPGDAEQAEDEAGPDFIEGEDPEGQLPEQELEAPSDSADMLGEVDFDLSDSGLIADEDVPAEVEQAEPEDTGEEELVMDTEEPPRPEQAEAVTENEEELLGMEEAGTPEGLHEDQARAPVEETVAEDVVSVDVEDEGIQAASDAGSPESDDGEEGQTPPDQDIADEAFDVSDELDALLTDLGVESPEQAGEEETDVDASKEALENTGAASEEADVDASEEALAVDMGRSQLAQGDLDAAEESFTSALDGSGGCEALLGLADIAQQRGEQEKAAEFLARAEPLLNNDEVRSMFDRLSKAQSA